LASAVAELHHSTVLCDVRGENSPTWAKTRLDPSFLAKPTVDLASLQTYTNYYKLRFGRLLKPIFMLQNSTQDPPQDKPMSSDPVSTQA